MKRDIHEAITERFIEQLKRGTVPWQKPWFAVQNIVSRNAELGAAFLSNETGILDSVRFENSAAYLASWIQKLENDPRMIVSAASQAQRATDFIMGIEHKESLQECQTTPEGMPLTWAREHGIDTRIPGFAHRDQDGDGVSTLMEWKHGTSPTDKLSRPHRQSLSL